MLSQSLRASRLGAARLARQHAPSARRTFVSTSTRQADMVQDIYLNQLKAYKIPQPKAGDEKGQVHEFKAPAAPQSPEEGDLANDLKAYESQEVEVEGQGPDASSSGSETNFFEDEDFGEEEEEEKAH